MDGGGGGAGGEAGVEAEPVDGLAGRMNGMQLDNPPDTNLRHFHAFVELTPLDQEIENLERRRGLAECIHGQVSLYRWHRGGESQQVVVKQMEEGRVEGSRAPLTTPAGSSDAALFFGRVRAHPEDAYAEIGVLCHLADLARQGDSCEHIQRLLGCFRETRPDKTFIWLMTEYCQGGELFNVIANGDPLDDAQLRRCMVQLLEAVRHLHHHNIGHRDISLENILLKEGEDDQHDLVLMDFGQAVQLRDDRGRTLRYYRPCAKDTYRPPEAFVPMGAGEAGAVPQVQCPADHPAGHVAPVQVEWRGYLAEYAFPADAVPGEAYDLPAAGYQVEPLDMFACGVAQFIMHMQKPPWGKALPFDACFKYVQAKGPSVLLQAWRRPMSAEAGELLAGLLQVNPAQRWTLRQASEHPWIAAGADG